MIEIEFGKSYTDNKKVFDFFSLEKIETEYLQPIYKSEKMLLPKAIKECRKYEKMYNCKMGIYFVYDPSLDYNLIYIGVGGAFKRKLSGRLVEHESDIFSNFKSDYLHNVPKKCKIKKYPHELSMKWDNLLWEFHLYSGRTKDDFNNNIIPVERRLILINNKKLIDQNLNVYNKENLKNTLKKARYNKLNNYAS